MDPLTCAEGDRFTFELQGSCTGKDIEKLACIRVKVPEFACARRNPFLNDAQALMFE